MKMVMNIRSILNSFRNVQNSHVIEDLLKSEDLTLEMLLDNNQEFIQELRSRNSNLLRFFNPFQISRLIDYIITDPSTDDFQRGHKYPFICNEAIECEVIELIDNFFNGTELLDKLFSFLDNETYNTTLYGYFSNVVQVLLKRNPYELLSYIHEQTKIGSKLPNFLHSSSIMGLMFKLLACEDHGNPAYESYLYDITELILYNFTRSSETPDSKNTMRIINSGKILVSLLTNHSENFNWSYILSKLSCPAEIESILNASLGHNQDAAAAANSVILAILHNINNEQSEDNIISAEIPPLIERMAEKMQEYKGILALNNPALGMARLQLIKVISSVLKLNYSPSSNAIKDCGMLSVIVVRNI